MVDSVLHELDQLQHNKSIPAKHPHDQNLLVANSSNFLWMAPLVPFPFMFFTLDPKWDFFLSINFLTDWPGPSGHFCTFYFYALNWTLKDNV